MADILASPQAVISYPTKTVRYDLTDFGSKDFVLLKDTVARNLIKHHGLETDRVCRGPRDRVSGAFDEIGLIFVYRDVHRIVYGF